MRHLFLPLSISRRAKLPFLGTVKFRIVDSHQVMLVGIEKTTGLRDTHGSEVAALVYQEKPSV